MKEQIPGPKKPLQKIAYHEHDPLPESSVAASANECTGLMFTPPENREEVESYQELTPMAFPRKEPGAAPQALRCPDPGTRREKRQS